MALGREGPARAPQQGTAACTRSLQIAPPPFKIELLQSRLTSQWQTRIPRAAATLVPNPPNSSLYSRAEREHNPFMPPCPAPPGAAPACRSPAMPARLCAAAGRQHRALLALPAPGPLRPPCASWWGLPVPEGSP